MECQQCQNVFRVLGSAYNAQVDADDLLKATAQTLVQEFGLKGCHFLILEREQKILEHGASFGLSETFLTKGPIGAERSVTEALNGATIMVKDCATDPRIQYPRECSEEGIVSLLTVPLICRGQVIGVMRLSTREARDFSPDEIAFFKVVATFCAGAIVHSMFHRILSNVTAAITSPRDLKEILDGIVRAVTENLRTRGSSIRLLDRKTGHLDMSASFGLSASYLEQTAESTGAAVAEALKGQCINIVDACSDPRILHRDAMISERIASILFVPLMTRQATIGVLSLYTNRPYVFSDDEKQLMLAIGEQCALALRNAQMYFEIEKRYRNVVDEFHQWFEHFHSYPSSE